MEMHYSSLNCDAFSKSFGIPSFKCSELILWMAEATNYDSVKRDELLNNEIAFHKAEKARTKDTFLIGLADGLSSTP